MSIFIKLAWRNLFRNKRRTIIAGTAIGIGLAALIFTDALMVGMEHNMIKSATASFIGEGQIHRAGYREVPELEKTIYKLDEVIAALEQEAIVEHFSVRTLAFGIVTSPSNLTSAQVVGVNPETEQWLSEIDDALVQGTYFEESSSRVIIIGDKMAEILEVGIGDRLVVTTSTAGSGNFAQEMFRVSGIYRFNIREMDQGLAFIPLKKAREMLEIGGRAHEIAIKFIDPGYGENRELPFWNRYSAWGNKAVGWNDILPQLEAVFSMSEFSILITAVILFGIVSLGIVNTLFMSLHERMFEFGVLRAIGTRPRSMAGLIVLEAGSLAIISILFGIILGYTVTAIFAKTGIDYRGIEFAGVTFKELLYPVMNFKQFFIYPLAVFGLTTFVSLYPAVFAARMSPASAIRKSM